MPSADVNDRESYPDSHGDEPPDWRAKHDGRIYHHEREYSLYGAVVASASKNRSRSYNPPRDRVSDPEQGEHIVEVDSNSRTHARYCLRLFGGMHDCPLVAPLMDKRECTRNVQQVEDATDRPYPPGNLFPRRRLYLMQ